MPTAKRRRRGRRRIASPLPSNSPDHQDGTITTANTMPMGTDDDRADGSPGDASPPTARTRRGSDAREESCRARRSSRVADAGTR